MARDCNAAVSRAAARGRRRRYGQRLWRHRMGAEGSDVLLDRQAHVNPRTDTDFVALVDSLMADADGPTTLEHRLRATHPHAVVRQRGLAGEMTEVWYVYRDGTWTDPGTTEVDAGG